MRHVNPGDPMSAASYNKLVDAHRRNELGTPQTQRRSGSDSNLVRVKNSSGGALAMGSVLEFTGFLLEDDFVGQKVFWLDGDTPDLTNVGWGILVEGIPDGKIGGAQIAGACPALVNIITEGDTHAWLKSGETVLQSGSAGPVKILHAPAGTGEKLCAVWISGTPAPRAGYLTETLAQGSTANATEAIWDGSAWVAGGSLKVTDFFLNVGESINANTKLIALPIGGVWVPIPYCAVTDTLPQGDPPSPPVLNAQSQADSLFTPPDDSNNDLALEGENYVWGRIPV